MSMQYANYCSGNTLGLYIVMSNLNMIADLPNLYNADTSMDRPASDLAFHSDYDISCNLGHIIHRHKHPFSMSTEWNAINGWSVGPNG